MLAAERQKKLVDLVNERLSIRVSELSDIFSVTEETIRRDLEKLEKENLLRRSHGGAVSIQKEQSEISYHEREITNAEDKKQIALEAIKHIQPGDQIVMGASSTAWYMAKELPDFPLTVLTNSIKVAVELSKKEQVRVISTGGLLVPQSLSFIGPLAERSLQSYHVNTAFLSCKGVHIDKGLSDTNEFQALLKKEMIGIADKTILLADASKFGVRTFAHIAQLGDVDLVITNKSIESSTAVSIREKGIDVKLV